MLSNVVKDDMKFGRYPLSGFHASVMLIMQFMSRVAHPNEVRKVVSFCQKISNFTKQRVFVFSLHLGGRGGRCR